MTTALFDYQTIVPHPIDDVFALTVDLQNAPHWHSIFTGVEQLTPNPIGLGSKWNVSLMEIIEGDRTRFRGDFVRGHFERESNAPDILTDVTIRVKEILYAQHLQRPAPDIPHPLDSGRLEFLLFGARDEYFISHKITLHDQPTDNAFHQVFEVLESTGQRLNFDLTRKAALLEIDSTHATARGRLPETDGNFPGKIKELIQDSEVPLPFELEVHPQHYLEMLM